MRPIGTPRGPFTGRTITETVYDDEAATGLMPGRPTSDVPDEGFGLAVEERVSVTDKASPGADGDLFDTKPRPPTGRHRHPLDEDRLLHRQHICHAGHVPIVPKGNTGMVASISQGLRPGGPHRTIFAQPAA